MTAMEMRRRVSRKDVSPVELTERALAKAERTQATLNAFFLMGLRGIEWANSGYEGPRKLCIC
jgi:Asp-tRNA(Asn)/Glu-tRNA(Gln) amidotransferase A subunit family amidase